MSAASFVRHAIAMRRDTRDKLSTFSRTLGLSQAEIIAALIDFVSVPERMAEFQRDVEKRLEAKRVLAESRQELLDALKDLSTEELRRLLADKT